jgi:epoxyqueuosine reductase
MTSDEIQAHARALGFDLCGVAPAADFPELHAFDDWIARGYAGGMAYLARSADRRADVRRVMPSARSVIVTGTVYNVERPYSTQIADPRRAHVARYAWGDDYHEVIGRRLDALVEWLRAQSREPFEARAYVDTGPVQERVYAQYAGLGWIGKNTCLINAELGSFLFLGVILCSLPLAPGAPGFDRCGACTLCLEACPTQAFAGPGVLDATRCISYLTIEHRGPIPADLAAGVGGHVYGCDVCQEVCPWNGRAATSADPAWQPRSAWDMRTIVELSRMSDDELRHAMRGSAMQRAKVAGLRRNLDVALANAEEPEVRR